jgi:DNA-binding winged helix-turn-helix (wHTH) protein/tetratricopeptide (TPR) repeat protein
MSSRVLRYEFGNYRLLPSERLLFHAGENIQLKSKVFETLLTLVRHPGKLLTKDQLMTEIWGKNFVEEANLTQNIFTLRKIFGENPRDHRFIVTVPGRGYRFVAPVETITEQKPAALTNGAVYASNGNNKSLAVLPLKFLMPKDAGSEKYLGLAIADTLITQLSATRKFAVRSTEAVLKYVGTEKDAIAIGRELEVEVILSGTIQTLNAKIRANLQLHDTRSGDTLWADKFDVAAGDFFEMQDRISSRATDALVSRQNENSRSHNISENSEVYRKYIKYRFFWETRTEEGLLASLAGGREIIAAAPDFPLGFICLADAYLLLGHHLYFPPAVVHANVARAVEKALELAPDLAEGYATKADYCFVSRRWEECEKYHRRAIALKPDYASGRHWYGWFLTAVGRFDEALEQMEQAQLLDVNSLYLLTVRGVPFAYKGDFERAIRQFQLVLEIDPNFKRAHYYLAWTLVHSGRLTEGVAELEEVVAAEPILQTVSLLGYAYGKTGDGGKARAMLRRIDRMEQEGKYVSPYHRAAVYAGLGDRNQALTELEKAFAENSIWLIWLKVDFQFQDLRDEPRFQDLIKRLGFPQ